MWQCKNQATIMSLILYSDIAEVGGGWWWWGGMGWLSTDCSTKTHCGAQLHTSIPAANLLGQQRKKNCSDSGQCGPR